MKGSRRKTCARACWLSFDAQPAQEDSEVSLRICSRDMANTSLRRSETSKLRLQISDFGNGAEGKNRAVATIETERVMMCLTPCSITICRDFTNDCYCLELDFLHFS